MGTTTTDRPRLSRVAALATAAATVAGLTLAAVAVSASAGAAQPARQAALPCLTLSSPNERDQDCGRRASADLDEPAQRVSFRIPGTRVCVVTPASRGCSRSGTATARDAGFQRIRFYAENTRFCGRAGARGVWGGIACANGTGWVSLAAGGDIDSISLWIPRVRT